MRLRGGSPTRRPRIDGRAGRSFGPLAGGRRRRQERLTALSKLQRVIGGTPSTLPEIPDPTARIYSGSTSGRAYGPVTTTSPSASYGLVPAEWMVYRWWMAVAPADSIALTGQYFDADSSMQRRIAVSERSRPMISWTTSISLKTWGYSSRCSPVTWIRYAWTSWRFLSAIETTSIALHDPRAARTVSTGLPP